MTASAPHGAPPADANLLGPGTRFEGLLTFRGGVRVDGVLRGEVRGSGRLVLGPSAEVDARVEVDEIVLSGRLHGEVRARQRAELLEGAELVGRLVAPRLTMADGARLQGPCTTGPAAGPDAPDGAAAAALPAPEDAPAAAAPEPAKGPARGPEAPGSGSESP